MVDGEYISMKLDEGVVTSLSPGVRDLVILLNELGFRTCDSGDGSNYAHGMGCAVPFPMIAIETDRSNLCSEADRLMHVLEERGVSFEPKTQEAGEDSPEAQFPHIDATYSPQDGHAVIVLYNVLSRDLNTGTEE